MKKYQNINLNQQNHFVDAMISEMLISIFPLPYTEGILFSPFVVPYHWQQTSEHHSDSTATNIFPLKTWVNYLAFIKTITVAISSD